MVKSGAAVAYAWGLFSDWHHWNDLMHVKSQVFVTFITVEGCLTGQYWSEN
jgi:hypothetical protein